MLSGDELTPEQEAELVRIRERTAEQVEAALENAGFTGLTNRGEQLSADFYFLTPSAMSPLGQLAPFTSSRLSGRCQFAKQTLVEVAGDGWGASRPDIPHGLGL